MDVAANFRGFVHESQDVDRCLGVDVPGSQRICR